MPPDAGPPSVSLCIPLYRPDPRYLERLVESVVAQAYPDLEVVMVDDASPGLDDDSFDALLAPLRQKLPIAASRNAHNLGMVGNWNRAVGLGHGRLVMCMSQDDELGAGMLAAYTAEFADPRVMIVAGAEQFVDADSRPMERRLNVGHRHNVFVHHDRYVLEHAEVVRLSLRNGQGFGEPSAVMFRRCVFDAVGGYDATFEHAADVDFNLRASAHGRAVYLNRAWLRRRWHVAGTTRTNLRTGAVARDRRRLYDRFAVTSELTERDRAEARAALASHSLYDMARAISRRQWGVVRVAADNLRFGVRAPAGVHAAHLVEIARHRNRDER